MLIINRCSVISGWGLFARARQGGNAVLCVLHLIPDDGLGMVVGKHGEGQKERRPFITRQRTVSRTWSVARPTDRPSSSSLRLLSVTLEVGGKKKEKR